MSFLLSGEEEGVALEEAKRRLVLSGLVVLLLVVVLVLLVVLGVEFLVPSLLSHIVIL